MSNTIKLKRGSGSDPSASDLVVGELAIRTDTGKIFLKKDNGNVAEVSGGGGIADGDKGDITVSNSGDTFTIDNNAVNSAKIANDSITANELANNSVGNSHIIDATITNAEISGSAAIAGTKISPNFGGQNILTTGQVQISGALPTIVLNDENDENDFNIQNINGTFAIGDIDAGEARLEINSSGVATFRKNLNALEGIDVTGVITGTSHIDLPDDARLKLGDNDEFTIFHQDSNNNSIIREQGGGDLSIQTNGANITLRDTANQVNMAQFITGGACQFNHGATTRLATSSTGVDVTGGITYSTTSIASGTLEFANTLATYDPSVGSAGSDTLTTAAISLRFGQQIVVNSDGYIRNLLKINSSADRNIEIGHTDTNYIGDILLLPGLAHAVRLRYNGSDRLVTNSTGVDVSGALDVTGNITATGNISATGGQLTLENGSEEQIHRFWSNTSDSDIYGLLSGSTFGTIVEGANNGHHVIALRGNDSNDSFAIVSGGGNYQTDSTYDTLIARFYAGGNVVMSGNLEVNNFIRSTNGYGVGATTVISASREIQNVTLNSSSVTATTQSAGNSTTRVATTAFVTTAISNLINNAPSALDTLKELSDALGADANFSTTVTNSLATKFAKAGGTLTGNVTLDKSGTANITIKSSDDYGTIEVGGSTGAFIDLKSPATDDYDTRFTHDGFIYAKNNITLSPTSGNVVNVARNLNAQEGLDVTGDITCTSDLTLDSTNTDHPRITLHSNAVGIRKYAIVNGQGWNPDALLIYDVDGDNTRLTIEPNGLGINRGANSISHGLDVGGTAIIRGATEIQGNLTISGTVDGRDIANGLMTGNLTGNSNLNTAQISGVYRINTGITNGTSGIGSYGTLLNCNNGSDTGFQIYANWNSHNYFIRGGNSSTFGGTGTNRAWAKIWNDQNDGSGSGLDADTLDGVQASSFLRSDANDNVGGVLTFVSGSGLDLATNNIAAGMRIISNGNPSSDGMYIGYGNANSGATRIFGGGATSNGISVVGSGNNDVKIAGNTVFHAGNDGAGSGLDADTVDNIQASSFLRSDANDTFTGTLTAGQDGKIAFPDNTTIPDNPNNEQHDYITFGAHGSISQVSGRGALMITSSDDALVLANGDVGRTFTASNINVDPENFYILSDGSFYVKTDLQEGFGTEHSLTFTNVGVLSVNNNTVFHAGNDGSGSGLDADKLDGEEGSYYRNASNINAGTLAAARVATLNQDTTGTADKATRIIVTDQSADTTCFPVFVQAATGNLTPHSGSNLTFNSSTGALVATSFSGNLNASNLNSGTVPDDRIPNHVKEIRTDNDITDRLDSGFYETATATTGEGWPETTNLWYHLIASTHSNVNNYYSLQIAGDFYNQGSFYMRKTNSSGTQAWSKIWTASNDGSGSGLDADTVDGVESSSFVRSDEADTISGDITFTDNGQYPVVIGAASGMNDGRLLLRGSDNPYIRFREGNTDKAYIQWNSNGNLYIVNEESGEQLAISNSTDGLVFVHDGTASKVWHSGNDGSGTGLDADTLDGVEGSSFLRSDTDETFSANLPVDNGNSSTLSVKCDDAGLALIRANGDGQGTGALEVGQSNDYGGGIAYNGDANPSFITGEQGDHITFYRLDNGTRTEVFHYPYNSSVVNFNSRPTIGGVGIVKTNDTIAQATNASTLDNIDSGSFLRSDTNDTIGADYEVNSGKRIRFGHANQVNSDDGGISAGKHGSGLNIVGTRTLSSGNRQVKIWGDVMASDGSTFWNAANDGSGSGLDADTLDGVEGTNYLRRDIAGSITGALTIDVNGTNDGATTLLTLDNYVSDLSNEYTWIDFTFRDSNANNTPQVRVGAQVMDDSGTGTQGEGAGDFVVQCAVDTASNTMTEMFRCSHDTKITSVHHHPQSDSSFDLGTSSVRWRNIYADTLYGNGANITNVNATTLDSIDSGSFLRSDAADTATGEITLQQNSTSTTNFSLHIRNQQSAPAQIKFSNNATNQNGYFFYRHEDAQSNSAGNSFHFNSDQSTTAVIIDQTTGNSGFYVGTNKVWHAGNDGSGSGLDADTLDSVQASSFLRLDADNTVTSYQNRTQWPSSSSIGTASGNQASLEVYQGTAGSDAFMAFHVAGDYAGYFGMDGGDNQFKVGGWSLGAVAYKVWHEGNDGSGSGLDADTLDGTQANAMIRSGAQSSVSGWHISGYRNGNGTSPYIYFSHSSGYGQHINTHNTSSGIYALQLHNNSKELFGVYNDGTAYHRGHVLPGDNNTWNLGSSSARWNNLYVNDMHFSNEGKTNDVDGTWGDWTLQEGEGDIFMINNRSGKKFKIAMIPV